VLEKGPEKASNTFFHVSNPFHILPVLGKHLMVRISPMQIEGFLRRKSLDGRSNKTVRHIVVLLGSVFNLAVENDLI